MTKTDNVPEVVITNKMMHEYIWMILKDFQNHDAVKIHMNEFNVGNGEHIAKLLCSVGVEIIHQKKVESLNTRTNRKMEVIEILLEKIPAAKHK